MKLVLAKRKVMRPVYTTRAQERELARLYLAVIEVWTESVSTRILPAYSRTLSGMVTDSVFDVEQAVQAADDGSVRSIFDFKWLFDNWFVRLFNWHTAKIIDNLKYATNTDLTSVIGPLPVDTAQAVIARNVALVKSVSTQTRDKIAEIVFRGLQNRTSPRDVAKEIARATGLARQRSLRIASDQLNKISSALDRQRMQSLGIDEFIWVHSGKVHFRPWHKARDGKKFRFDDPALAGDLPGDAVACGCKSRGVLPDGG